MKTIKHTLMFRKSGLLLFGFFIFMTIYTQHLFFIILATFMIPLTVSFKKEII